MLSKKEIIRIQILDNSNKTTVKTEKKNAIFYILIQELNSTGMKCKMKTIWLHRISN